MDIHFAVKLTRHTNFLIYYGPASQKVKRNILRPRPSGSHSIPAHHPPSLRPNRNFRIITSCIALFGFALFYILTSISMFSEISRITYLTNNHKFILHRNDIYLKLYLIRLTYWFSQISDSSLNLKQRSSAFYHECEEAESNKLRE